MDNHNLVKVKNTSPEIDWREWSKAVLLLGMAIYLTFLIVTGNLSNYINVRFQWLTYVAAGSLFFLGIWQTWAMLRGGRPQVLTFAGEPLHLPVSWGTLAVVAIPLALGALIPSQPLGAEAIEDVSLNPVGIGVTSAYDIAPEERNILDWLRVYADVDDPDQLNGQPVDVIGFIYREPTFGDDQFMITRLTLSCCVADAFPIGMPVQFDAATGWETGTWVRITGTLQTGTFDGETLPVIQPDGIEPTEIPDAPYLYS